MIKKLIFISLLFLSQFSNAQKYVDLFSINYGKSAVTSYENGSQSTTITNIDIDFTLPIKLDEKNAIITGIDFSNNILQLFPDASYNNLYLTRIKTGINIIHSEHWSGTYIFLPKISSDYINVSMEDFYIGGLVVLKYRKRNNLSYKFGLYAGNEAFGLFISPVIGLYYLSPNSSFEMNLYLPSNADINYSLTNKTKAGIDFVARGKSYKLTTDDVRSSYAENNSLEFSSYLQNNSLNKNMLIRLKLGFSTNSFEVYPIDQKITFATTLLKFGDHRTQLNSTLSSSPFIKIEAIYRFDIPTSKEK
ncbi:MAG TPA: DUF6268 family outer membrane beta-barrel protein [Flavobacterium alvei]|nr:DUF6268 family outer membrane beta-barrel protein [Flavobacterium alvei]HQF47288.1 DUF6268 family outer membrane beta-barrel protein [Flavobacterium alvei]HQK38830.1 DUF6268 family outer membrane beta-barrel protein [Flavobacterium alvei]